jgi:hypothetical protein
MALSIELLAILACPRCKGVVQGSPDATAVICPACCLKYPVRDGIPVMLVDEAEQIGAKDPGTRDR